MSGRRPAPPATTPAPGTDGAAPAGPPDAAPGLRARQRGPSARPALIVVGIAAVLVLAFGIGGALEHGTPAPSGSSAPVDAAGLRSIPAAGALAPIEQADTPPSDVVRSLVIPSGATRTKASPWDGFSQYAASATFSEAASQSAVVAFYRAALATRGWRIVSTGPARNQPRATQVLAQRASNDGWYWEVGVTVQPTSFGSSGTSDTTDFALRLIELQDAT